MSDFRKKQKMRRILYSKTMIGVLLVVVVVVAINTWEVLRKQRTAHTARMRAEAEHAELEERKVFLSEEIERLESEAGVEEEIRGRYGVAKPGEHVIVLIDDTDMDEKKEQDESKGLWSKIKNIF